MQTFRLKILIYCAVREKDIDCNGQTFFTVQWAIDGLYRDRVLVYGERYLSYINSLVKVNGYEIQSFQNLFEIDRHPNLYIQISFNHTEADGVYSLIQLDMKYCGGYI